MGNFDKDDIKLKIREVIRNIFKYPDDNMRIIQSWARKINESYKTKHFALSKLDDDDNLSIDKSKKIFSNMKMRKKRIAEDIYPYLRSYGDRIDKQTAYENYEFIIETVEYYLQQMGLLLKRKTRDLHFSAIYLNKFLEMLDKFEEFVNKQKLDEHELNAHVAIIINYDFWT